MPSRKHDPSPDPLARFLGTFPPPPQAPSAAEPDLFARLPTPAVLSTQQEAQAAAEAHANERYAQVLSLLRERGPMACWEIADALGCQLNAISGRMSELKDQHAIEPTSQRRPNPRTAAAAK